MRTFLLSTGLAPNHLLGRVQVGPTKVYEYLYLGSWQNSSDIANLKTLGITGIVNAAAEYKILQELACKAQNRERKSPIEFDVCFLNLYDDDRFTHTFKSSLNSAISFIDTHRQRGGKVLVQCNNGIERSAAIVLAYFMRQEKLSYERALAALRNRGVVIHPNSWLEAMLEDEDEDAMSDD